MNDATLDVVMCGSCSTPMLNYYTDDRLMTYACPNCMDWSGSDANLVFIN